MEENNLQELQGIKNHTVTGVFLCCQDQRLPPPAFKQRPFKIKLGEKKCLKQERRYKQTGDFNHESYQRTDSAKLLPPSGGAASLESTGRGSRRRRRANTAPPIYQRWKFSWLRFFTESDFFRSEQNLF